MSEWLIYITVANLIVTLILLPLLKFVWEIRREVTEINGKVKSHAQRLDRLERQQDQA